MALALPISHQLHASAGITALGVMLTGHTPEPAYYTAYYTASTPLTNCVDYKVCAFETRLTHHTLQIRLTEVELHACR